MPGSKCKLLASDPMRAARDTERVGVIDYTSSRP